MKHNGKKVFQKKTIFQALFIPLFVIMILQAILFYVVAVYGGIEETTNQNTADILTERLLNRKNELETQFNKTWTDLSVSEEQLDALYANYKLDLGDMPLTQDNDTRVSFLGDSAAILVDLLRQNEVNGVFLILNDEKTKQSFEQEASHEKTGLCIRDLDATSNYTGTGDLLVERAPSVVIEQLGCSLDSWWEARYSFDTQEAGAYYYNPLMIAWENPDVSSDDLAYLQGAHKISGSDQEVISYSIPLMDKNGYPYGVLGIELTTQYLASLLPNKELGDPNKTCYVLAMENQETKECLPVVGSGAIYNRCFGSGTVINCDNTTSTGGFLVSGREDTQLYGNNAAIEVYNSNNPFEQDQLTLLAMVENKAMFSYMDRIKRTLALVSSFSLILGLFGIFVVSRRFSGPITELAKKVDSVSPQDGFELERLGILEIDQLVNSIEELNRNASRDIARTEFFSRMSHDMRTPMNAIISFSSRELLEDTDDAKKMEYLEKIHTSGEYLLGLINEVLDMTKIESNKVDLQFAPVSSRRLLETTVPIIEKLAQKKSIFFEKDIQVEDAVVMADMQHLNQIMINLLSNAVKFTSEGGKVSLTFHLTGKDAPVGKINCYVIVSDTGIGMSEAFMQQLYTPFVQENEIPGGTGLGLSIAKKLIEMMGGTIECRSKKGLGTTFTIQFAMDQAIPEQGQLASTDLESQEEQSLEAVKEEEIKTREVLQGKHILVCEDQPINTQIIVRLLEREGIVVTTAENGQIGAETFAASGLFEFDAVLMDIRMPLMDGLEAAKTIRAMNREDAAAVPIIAMTANAFAEDVRASSAAGMNAHLSKPIEPQKLYFTLSTYLKSE